MRLTFANVAIPRMKGFEPANNYAVKMLTAVSGSKQCARPTGFEPVTRLGSRSYSIQLRAAAQPCSPSPHGVGPRGAMQLTIDFCNRSWRVHVAVKGTLRTRIGDEAHH